MKLAVKIVLAFALLVAAFFVHRLRSLAVESRSLGPPGAGPAGTLAPCASPMRCVLTELVVPGTVEEARKKITDAIVATGGEVRSSRPEYLHAEYRTKLWGFVDDVEVQFPSTGGRYPVRSASRVGKSDLGANRKRVDRLRSTLGP